MKKGNRSQKVLPETFPSYEAAADFWDKNDSADFAEDLLPVSAEVRLERRHFEIELDEEVVQAVEKRARARKVPTGAMANELLRRDLALA